MDSHDDHLFECQKRLLIDFNSNLYFYYSYICIDQTGREFITMITLTPSMLFMYFDNYMYDTYIHIYEVLHEDQDYN